MNELDIKSETIEMLAEKLGKSAIEIHAILTAYVKVDACASLIYTASVCCLAVLMILGLTLLIFKIVKNDDNDGDDITFKSLGSFFAAFVLFVVFAVSGGHVRDACVALKAPEAVAIKDMIKMIR